MKRSKIELPVATFQTAIRDTWKLGQDTLRRNIIEAILRDPNIQQLPVNSIDDIVRIVEKSK